MSEPVKITFGQLCELEPRLPDLERQAQELADPQDTDWFCSNFAWLPLNAQLKALIGVARPGVESAEMSDLRYSSRSYEVAYLHLSAFLPPCRNCGCVRFHPILDHQLATGEQTPPEAYAQVVRETAESARESTADGEDVGGGEGQLAPA